MIATFSWKNEDLSNRLKHINYESYAKDDAKSFLPID